ncbi:hypothetical protein ACDX78_13600 [Virgibacillus oceani]
MSEPIKVDKLNFGSNGLGFTLEAIRIVDGKEEAVEQVMFMTREEAVLYAGKNYELPKGEEVE